MKVEEQVVEGDRVISRFVVSGRSGGRRVRFNGITISRFENGKIVEDPPTRSASCASSDRGARSCSAIEAAGFSVVQAETIPGPFPIGYVAAVRS